MSLSGKEVEIQILEAGEKLLDPPSSLDELLSLLDKLIICLADVEQSPSESMQNALSPLMKALVAEKLFKHSDVDVKVAVAACISDITRITAPEAPYDDDQMKEVFKLIVSSFENLDDKSSRSYFKRCSILDIVAKVRSCVVMLDLECDALLIEMFQSFLNAIRDHHEESVYSSMENIMTLVLEESEDVPPEMLSPILHYVRKDDEVPQVSRKLAERVLSNCSSKLKTYLPEAVKSSGVSLDKYSDVVALICEGTSSAMQQDQLVTNEKEHSQGLLTKEAEVEDKEKVAEICTPDQTDVPTDESGKSGVSNGVAQRNDSSADTEPTKKQDDTNAKNESQQLDNPCDTNLDNTSEVKPDVEHQIEENVKQPCSVKQADSSRTSNIKEEAEPGALLDRQADSSKNSDGLSLPPDDSCINSPSRTKDLLQETANQKIKETSTKEAKSSAAGANEEASDEPKTSEAKVTKKSGKKVASSSKAKPAVPSSKKSVAETKAAKQSEKKAVESDNVPESSKPEEENNKKELGEAMDEDSLHTSSGDNEKPAASSGKSASKSKKGVKQSLEENPNTNGNRKRSLGKEKASDIQNYDENLVKSKVRVWWPMDRVYYKGVVKSYDSAKKKHLVVYDDGDQEILNLKKQKWYFQHEPEEDEEAADQTGQDGEASTAPQKKKAKTTGKQTKMDSAGKKGDRAGSSKSKAAPASKSGKKSQDEKTENNPKDSMEVDRKEEEGSDEEILKTVGKSGGAKSGSSKEEPAKTATKTKLGPSKSSSAKGKTGKGKKGKTSYASTPSSKAKESDGESEAEETPKATETGTKGKSVGSGKSQGSQAKSGKKRKR